MRYLGGKTRIAKQLAAEIDKVRRPGQWVWDAFCGGLSMTVALSKNGPVYSTDACVPLINMYRAVQAGWDPPSVVDEATYRAAKALPDTDPMKAFCGFAGSFGGMWFGGYIPSTATHTLPNGRLCVNRPYAAGGRIIKRDVAFASGIDCVNFLDCAPQPVDGVLYLDPPYAGTIGYAGVAPFDHAVFYSRVREWSEHCHVFVSEYQMSFGVEVWKRTYNTGMHSGVERTERLYFVERGSL